MTIPLLFSMAGIIPVADEPYGFTVPHKLDTSYPFPWQSDWTEADADILHYGLGRRDALTGGGRITAQIVPNYSVAVGAFTGQLRSTGYSGIATNLTPAPPDPDYPRVDLIVSNSGGGIYCIAGTPARTPRPPSLPGAGTAVAHAMLSIPPGCTKIYQGYLVDKRILIATAFTATHNYSTLNGHASDTAITMGTTVYGGFVGRFTPGSTETDFQIVVPRAGTISLFSIVTGAANVNANLVVTLRKNAVDTALVVTVADGQAAGVYTDNSHTVNVAAGDKLGIKFAETGAFANSAVIRGVSGLYDAP